MALQMTFQNLAAISANFPEFITKNAEKVLNMGYDPDRVYEAVAERHPDARDIVARVRPRSQARPPRR